MPVVVFLPYFPDTRVDRVVGGFRLWNWWQQRERCVTDARARQRLDLHFGLYRRATGELEERIAVLSPEGGLFFTEENFPARELERVVGALMVSHLFDFPRDPKEGWRACSSDNFVASALPFDPTKEQPHAALTFGSYIKTDVTGPWDVLRFTTPQYIPDPVNVTFEAGLLEKLCGLRSEPGEAVERLFRSFDWVRLAFANYSELQYTARIVSMSAAFEILLDFPPTAGKAKFFASSLNRLIPPNRLPTEKRPYGRRGDPVSDNLVGWWGRQFYELRSKIIHGTALTREDFFHATTGVDHLRIGLSLYEECLRGLLVEMGRLPELARRTRFWSHSPWRSYLALPENVWYPTEDFLSGE